MQILTIDIGTGTQDIFLYDSRLAIENGFKLVLPSPTMMIHRRIKQATARGGAIALVGDQMGGGPSAWAAASHARLGFPVFATPEAARTLDDDLARVAAMGVRIVSDDEAARLPADVQRIRLGDFDFETIASVFRRFGAPLQDLQAVAAAAFDHGAAPPGISDRQFRFDYLDQRIRKQNSLSAFAFRASEVPEIMSRLKAVARAAATLGCPLIVMDTAPAAILGSLFDPAVAARERKLLVNIGNFHTLAFRLRGASIEGLFEHHTGEIELSKLESMLLALADGSLRHEDVFNDMGHGALLYDSSPLALGSESYDVVVTGPRRGLYRPDPASQIARLRPYFAAPFGDMMLTGCFGLLAATADLLPDLADTIRGSMSRLSSSGTAPWDAQ